MEINHNGNFLPDATPTGGPSTTSLDVRDGTGISWVSSRVAGRVVLTPSVVNSALPGSEVGYDQITASVSVTGLTSGTATAVISCSAHTFDGSPVVLDFFSPLVRTPSVLASRIFVGLSEAGTVIAQLGEAKPSAAANQDLPWRSALRFTPSAGSHTYTIVSWVDSATGTPLVAAGTGTAGGFAPAFARFTKA